MSTVESSLGSADYDVSDFRANSNILLDSLWRQVRLVYKKLRTGTKTGNVLMSVVSNVDPGDAEKLVYQGSPGCGQLFPRKVFYNPGSLGVATSRKLEMQF